MCGSVSEYVCRLRFCCFTKSLMNIRTKHQKTTPQGWFSLVRGRMVTYSSRRTRSSSWPSGRRRSPPRGWSGDRCSRPSGSRRPHAVCIHLKDFKGIILKSSKNRQFYTILERITKLRSGTLIYIENRLWSRRFSLLSVVSLFHADFATIIPIQCTAPQVRNLFLRSSFPRAIHSRHGLRGIWNCPAEFRLPFD